MSIVTAGARAPSAIEDEAHVYGRMTQRRRGLTLTGFLDFVQENDDRSLRLVTTRPSTRGDFWCLRFDPCLEIWGLGYCPAEVWLKL